MIELDRHVDGVIVPVRAQPGARRNGIVGEHAGALKLAVTAPPERGRANQALAELLAEILEIKRTQVELLSGENSRSKRFLVRGAVLAQVRKRLNASISPP